MKFNHQVIHDGKLYYAGQEVPIKPTNTEPPKPEKVEEAVKVEIKVDEEVVAEIETEENQVDVVLDGAKVEKAVKKANKKK